MKTIEKGNIIYFKYKRYHKDPTPLALVLYSDDTIMHCLNLHYLKGELTQKVLQMIAMIITRRLTKNTYKLYHSYMKFAMSDVVKKAYRTYKPQYVAHVAFVSNGFAQTMSFLSMLMPITKKELIEKKIINKLKAEIKTTKNVSPDKFIQIQIKKSISPERINQHVENYMAQIKKILGNKSEKKSEQYTFLFTKKPKK